VSIVSRPSEISRFAKSPLVGFKSSVLTTRWAFAIGSVVGAISFLANVPMLGCTLSIRALIAARLGFNGRINGE
jgi:hypothetical protein